MYSNTVSINSLSDEILFVTIDEPELDVPSLVTGLHCADVNLIFSKESSASSDEAVIVGLMNRYHCSCGFLDCF